MSISCQQVSSIIILTASYQVDFENNDENFILTAEGAKQTKSPKKTRTAAGSEGRTKSQIFADGSDSAKKSSATGEFFLHFFASEFFLALPELRRMRAFIDYADAPENELAVLTE